MASSPQPSSGNLPEELFEVFPNAPVREAVIDVRVVPQTDDALNRIDSLAKSIEDDFPHNKQIHTVQKTFPVDGDGEETTHRERLGTVFASPDEKELFQARINGFTFSRLEPYTEWPQFAAAARSAWDRYTDAIGQHVVQRVAVRYINRLDFPTGVDLEQYLTVLPQLPAGVGDNVVGFLTRVEVPKPELNARLILTQGGTPPPAVNQVSVLIDIDIFCDAGAPQDSESLWAYLDALRIEKNKVFHACITEDTKEVLRNGS